MSPAHRVELTLTEDGKLSLDRLPFRSGQAVEVIVLARPTARPAPISVQGAVVRFDRPTDPVADGEWGVGS
jgi:hypothetical protein